MTSYTDIFTGNPVQSSPTSYREFTIDANTELSWPLQNEDSSNVVADTMEISASTASLSLTLPPANQVGKGKATIIRNVGANTFTVKGNSGTTIRSVAAGEVFWVYVTDNSSVAGEWSSFQYGTGTSSADAATLAGYGLIAVSSTLNLAFPVTAFNSSDTLTTGYRAQMVNWTGGAGTFSFSACANLGDNWFVLVRNSGSGALTLNPNGSETIDGVSTINLDTGDSCIVSCDGTSLYTIGRNSSTTTATFTRLVKSVAGSSNVTLTSAEAAYDVQEYTGAITASISVIVPTSVGRWWVYNNTSGAFTLTVKTAAGTGIAIAQGTRQIVHCDGTNVVLSVDAGTGTVTSIATGTGLSGGPITTSGTISLANTAVAAGSYGSTTQVGTFTVDAQGRLTSASNATIASQAPFSDASALVKNSSDATKQIILSASAIAAGTTVTLVAPTANTTLVGSNSAQTLTNKALSDSTTYIIDNSDATKIAQFECSTISTATVRTFTFPDKNGTFAMTSDIPSPVLVKINSQSASASPEIDFTGLSSTYSKYIIECIDVVPATASSFRARVNAGSGIISTSTYDTYGAGRDSAGNPVNLELVAATYMDLSAGISLDTTSTIGNNFKIEIIMPSHSKRTRIRFESEFKTDGLSRENHACGGGHNTAITPVTGLRVYMGSGNITSGTFILYGVL